MNKIVKFSLLFIFFNLFCSLSGFLFPQIGQTSESSTCPIPLPYSK